MMLALRSFFILFCLILSGISEAKVLQILHTNDLHASLNVSGAAAPGEQVYGGWAQIKTVMDALTATAKSQNIETIRLDAGDFFEGTLSYFPDHGANVLKAFQTIGYDAAALGNHDWMMGARNTDKVYGQVPFPFPVLSANIELNPDLKNLNRQIKPNTQIIKDGIRIGVFGLSTDEVFYKWITKVDSKKCDMRIYDYRDFQSSEDQTAMGIANDEARKLRQENDLVIALTHIGFKEDQKLAASSSEIDLIVGGHSHTRLETLSIVDNINGAPVPIVQTGDTGVFIGKILVDVEPGQKPRVLTYELVPVYQEFPADPEMVQLLQQSEKRIENQFGAQKLNQVIGFSETELISGSGGTTAYSKFIVDAMKDIAQTDIAVDIGEFHSNSAQSRGDVTFRKLMEMYPRKLNAEQNEGLYVYRFRIPGWALKLAIKLSVQFGYQLSTSGIEYKTERISDKQFQDEIQSYGDSWKSYALTQNRVLDDSILINGKKIKFFKKYTVASPEFLIRGAYAISFFTRLILRGGKPTPFTIWEASQKYLAKIKVIKDDPGFLKMASIKNINTDYPYARDFIGNVLQTLQMHKKRMNIKDEDQDDETDQKPVQSLPESEVESLFP